MARRNLYRDVFFAHNGAGPYACHFCAEPVSLELVTVHHLDDDHDNNAVVNLVPAHGPCHTRHHARQPHRLAQLAEAQKMRTPEGRRRASVAMNAAQTHESRSAAARRRWARYRGEID